MKSFTLIFVVFTWCLQTTFSLDSNTLRHLLQSISSSNSNSNSSSSSGSISDSIESVEGTDSPATSATPSPVAAEAVTCSLTGSIYTGGVITDRLAWIALNEQGTPIRVDILFETIKNTPFGDVDAATFFETNRIVTATKETGSSQTGYILTEPITAGTGPRWILKGDVDEWIENAGLSQANTEAELEVVGALSADVHAFSQIISDCNQEILLVDEDNEVWELGVGSVDSDLIFDETRVVGYMPGNELADSTAATYNFVSGQIMIITNMGSMSMLTQWTLDCPSSPGMSWIVTPSGNCGDGDITNLEFAGVADAATNPFGLDGPVFNIGCTTGVGTAGNPNPAYLSFVNGDLQVLPESVDLASTLIPETGFIRGQIALAPGNAEGCDISDEAECVDTEELETCVV